MPCICQYIHIIPTPRTPRYSRCFRGTAISHRDVITRLYAGTDAAVSCCEARPAVKGEYGPGPLPSSSSSRAGPPWVAGVVAPPPPGAVAEAEEEKEGAGWW